MPIIGFLYPQSPEAIAEPMRGLRQGLKDTGFVEGENLTIEYRWADNRTERLTALAEDLVRRRVALIISTGGVQSALALKAATMSIPIPVLARAHRQSDCACPRFRQRPNARLRNAHLRNDGERPLSAAIRSACPSLCRRSEPAAPNGQELFAWRFGLASDGRRRI